MNAEERDRAEAVALAATDGWTVEMDDVGWWCVCREGKVCRREDGSEVRYGHESSAVSVMLALARQG